MIRFDVLSVFPEMLHSPLDFSLLKKAREKGLIEVGLYDIRDWAQDKHKMTDDAPYGGGCGMVMKVEPVERAVNALKRADVDPLVVLMTPQGETFNQRIALELSRQKHLIFICGRYEGVDERIRKHLANREISIGDYILTGGELSALVVIDAVARLIPGVLGNAASAQTESFSQGLLECPGTQDLRIIKAGVPEVLVPEIMHGLKAGKGLKALKRTWKRRPDLLEKVDLSKEDRGFGKIKLGLI